MQDLKDNVVLITGGGRGIGLGIAKAFAECGSRLVLTGRTERILREAQKEIEETYHTQVITFVADGVNEAAVKKVVTETIRCYGQLNALINNAQSSKNAVIKDLTTEDFDFTLRANLYAAFFYMRECYPYLKETQGSVINFASGAGMFGKYGMAPYGMAKEAIRSLTRTAASEWGPDQINVNVIVPLVLTEQMKQYRETDPEGFARMVKIPPFGRFGDAKTDVGRVCCFLASKDAKFITGETITIQGGNSLRP